MPRAAVERSNLTTRTIEAVKPPPSGVMTIWDSKLKGFGARVRPSGSIVYVLRYTTQAGRQRLLTLGPHPALSPNAARDLALKHKHSIIGGADPVENRDELRAAETFGDLIDRYLSAHVATKNRPSTARRNKQQLAADVPASLRAKPVAAITERDIRRIHEKRADKPYSANRLLRVLSKVFSIAVKEDLISKNPAKGIEHYPEAKRERWLTADEIDRLSAALATDPNRRAANLFRFLLLTGARKGETLEATWDQINLEQGIWTKPSAHTKQRREHVVPLSAPARLLLSEMHTAAKEDGFPSPFLFPGDPPRNPLPKDATLKPLQSPKRAWETVCKRAGIKGARMHDLRHSFAAHLASGGTSLHMIGRLLGHTQSATTARYAHLAIDPLREASERMGAIVSRTDPARPSAEVVALPRAKG
jgi:integrase